MDNQGNPSDAVDMSSQQTRTITTSSKWRRFVPGPTSTFILAIFVLSLLMNGGFNPTTKRGFFCNDSTIRYPFKPDTISFKELLVIALLIPCIIIKILQERLSRSLKALTIDPKSRYRKDSEICLDVGRGEDAQLMTPTTGDKVKRRLVVNDDDGSDLEAVDKDTICDNSFDELGDPSTRSVNNKPGPTDDETRNNCEPRATQVATSADFRKIVRDTRSAIKDFSDLQLYLFGFTATSFLTGIGKLTCGRFRPHFMERCKPDIDCTQASNLYRYISDFKCTNEALRPRDYSYITTSWPSGHASIVFFAMFYLIFYSDTAIKTLMSLKAIRGSSKIRYNPLIVYSIYVLLIGTATYVSLTRVSDYHHHPLDVLSGSILGAITAVIVANFMLKPRFAPITNSLNSSSILR